ncbi:MAG: MFS transporter, partial [Anaerolineales bacterium]|nr:MFS transporter [Anaerolineales bacterium]
LAILFRLASAFYHVPYQSLLPEIASTERHRIRISAWQSAFLLLGMMLGGLSGLLIENLGFQITILIYAAVILPLLVFPIFFLREKSDRQIHAQQRIGFWESISLAFRNQAFMIFAIVWAIYLMTTTLVQSSVPFIVTEVCQLSQSQTIFFYIPGIVASLAWYPIVTMLANRWGKMKVYLSSYLASAIIFPGTILMGEWMLVPLKAQCVSWAVLQAVAISGVVVLSSAFIAEITDADEAKTGQRREGVYFAVMKVLDQLFSGVAMFLLPIILLLGRSQFSPQGPLGVRMTGVVAGILMLIGFFVCRRFEI